MTSDSHRFWAALLLILSCTAGCAHSVTVQDELSSVEPSAQATFESNPRPPVAERWVEVLVEKLTYNGTPSPASDYEATKKLLDDTGLFTAVHLPGETDPPTLRIWRD